MFQTTNQNRVTKGVECRYGLYMLNIDTVLINKYNRLVSLVHGGSLGVEVQYVGLIRGLYL